MGLLFFFSDPLLKYPNEKKVSGSFSQVSYKDHFVFGYHRRKTVDFLTMFEEANKNLIKCVLNITESQTLQCSQRQ